ncbi:MAG: hypothetical protein IT204_02635 [Fimbriimonadaceae bacterium]|nr:hypothetical protein [Fimbriimonadaceae bacterium]
MADGLQIGWAQVDLTPPEPVLVAGQFPSRVSEGVADPITATVLVLEGGGDQAVFVSCDIVTISHDLRDAVRGRLAAVAGLDPLKVMVSGTHTHTGPDCRLDSSGAAHTSLDCGIDLPVMPVEQYIEFAAERLAGAVRAAWEQRAPGAVAYGLGYAVVGRNRRWTSTAGVNTMYGNTNVAEFSHIEGYEDHSVNVLATWLPDGSLSGLVVNVACPSQCSEHEHLLSADYWYETRQVLRARYGEGLPILAQCSAAGDQSPHLIYEKRANQRMLELAGRTPRQEIAQRLGRAVDEVLEQIAATRSDQVAVAHRVLPLEVPLACLTLDDVATAEAEIIALRATYEAERAKLEADPSLRERPRWYYPITAAHRRMRWFQGVVDRYHRQQTAPNLPIEVHVIRVGDIAFATNPFEYYLDYGIHIKARSAALQTFLVQLTGPGTYVPSSRAQAGGGYGAVPASNPVGPAGGWQVAQTTVAEIAALWATA